MYNKYENIRRVIVSGIVAEQKMLNEANIKHFPKVLDVLYGDKLSYVLNDFYTISSVGIKSLSEHNYDVCLGALSEIREYPDVIEGLTRQDIVGKNGLITTILARPVFLGNLVIDIVKKFRLYFELFSGLNELKVSLKDLLQNTQYSNLPLMLRRRNGALITKIDTLLKRLRSFPLKFESREMKLNRKRLYEEVISRDKFLVFWKQGMGRAVEKVLGSYLKYYEHKYKNNYPSVKTELSNIRQNISDLINTDSVFYNETNNDNLKVIMLLPVVFYSSFLTNVLYFVKDIISTQEFISDFGFDELDDDDYRDTSLMNYIVNKLVNSEKFKKALKQYIEKPYELTNIRLNNLVIYIQETPYKVSDIITIFDSLTAKEV